MKEISSCCIIKSISITKSKTKVKATKKQAQSHFWFSFSMAIINSRPKASLKLSSLFYLKVKIISSGDIVTETKLDIKRNLNFCIFDKKIQAKIK
jgi:hypothetical protein